MQKRVLAIHDISCVGRCSLTVALPSLSAGGVECSVLPTAVLSTHTGEFTGFTCHDLTDQIAPITHHLQSLGLCWDALFVGFLGSYEQIALIDRAYDQLKGERTLFLVDPAMADHGEVYQTYTPEMVAGTRRLCRRADIITPNLTEAALLLEEKYNPHPAPGQVEEMLKRLYQLGAKNPVITGVSREEGMTGAAAFDGESFHWAQTPSYPQAFYGTGDVFSSALLTGLMTGRDLAQAVDLAVGFTHEAICHTLQEGRPLRYGPCFEKALPWLMERV